MLAHKPKKDSEEGPKVSATRQTFIKSSALQNKTKKTPCTLSPANWIETPTPAANSEMQNLVTIPERASINPKLRNPKNAHAHAPKTLNPKTLILEALRARPWTRSEDLGTRLRRSLAARLCSKGAVFPKLHRNLEFRYDEGYQKSYRCLKGSHKSYKAVEGRLEARQASSVSLNNYKGVFRGMLHIRAVSRNNPASHCLGLGLRDRVKPSGLRLQSFGFSTGGWQALRQAESIPKHQHRRAQYQYALVMGLAFHHIKVPVLTSESFYGSLHIPI